jgi:membrane protein DedA with SNARE-associated domain
MHIKSSFKEILKLLSIPLILLAIYLSMYIIWKVLGLPTDEQMLIVVREWFLKYGLSIVFISALIEGFLLLGQYFPGGFIIFLGVISAGKNVFRATEVVLVVCCAFFIAYTLNYWVGKYGWYKLLIKFGLGQQLEKSKNTLTKQGLNTIFFSYWEPNLASLTATAAGILHIPLGKFLLYSSMGIILWNIFWGVLVYTLGESALNIVGLKWVLIIFVLWIGVILLKKYFFDKRSLTKV